MIMESCGIDDGVSVSLAFNESEAYSSAKEKQMKDVFSEKKIRFEEYIWLFDEYKVLLDIEVKKWE